MGDTWIPPNGKLYTVPEIHQVFSDRRVLIIGDSLARRLTATLATVLAIESNADLLDSDIDNKSTLGYGGHGSAEYNQGRLRFQWAPFARDVANLGHRDDLARFSTVVVALGVHDAEEPNPNVMRDFKSALAALEASSPPEIVWRTAPFMDSNNQKRTHEVNGRVTSFNALVSAQPGRVRVLDVGRVLQAKSTGKERLRGDTPQHFGNIARMVGIQIITHALQCWDVSN